LEEKEDVKYFKSIDCVLNGFVNSNS